MINAKFQEHRTKIFVLEKHLLKAFITFGNGGHLGHVTKTFI